MTAEKISGPEPSEPLIFYAFLSCFTVLSQYSHKSLVISKKVLQKY